jgi:methyl-accepting chemotaxis protein
MTDKTLRRPFSNFFVKKSMQVSIIARIVLVVLVSTALTTLLLAFIYNAKSQSGSFYYMSDNIMEDLKLHSILGLVLPALISAQVVALLITLGIGLFSSRKIAVPQYKIEKWASQLGEGNLNTRLAFRETREMQELTERCNAVATTYRDIFVEIDRSVGAIEKEPGDSRTVSAEVKKVRTILDKLQYGGS